MAGKKARIKAEQRRIQAKAAGQQKETDVTTAAIIDSSLLSIDSTCDQSNAFILPGSSGKKNQTKLKKGPEPKPKKVLSKKKQKKLQQVLRRRQLKEDRVQVLENLAKYRLTEDEMKSMLSQGKDDRKGKKRRKSSITKDSDIEENDEEEEAGRSNEKKVKRMPLPEEVEEEIQDPNIVSYKPGQDDEEDTEEEEEEIVESVKQKEVKDDNNNEGKTDGGKSADIHPEKKQPEVMPKKTSQKPASEPAVYVAVDRSPEIEEARNKLPILGEEQLIVETIRYNDVVIICGETGSGKTTQVPQFLYEAGYASPSSTSDAKHKKRMICITEPRRVAAISMSRRVAHEMNLSSKVISYHIRYDHNVTKETRMKFVTDGVLLKEIQSDFCLENYSVVIIDEAHERSVFSDILIGLLSRIVNLRKKNGNPLKLVIMSATLRVDDFASNSRLFKTSPPVLRIESRQYPVTIHFSKITPENYVNAALSKVAKIHRTCPDGGILVFVTGRNEVITLVKKLRRMFPPPNTNEEEKEDPEPIIPKKIVKKLRPRKPTKVGDLLPKISLDDFNEATKDNFKDDTLDSDDDVNSNDDDEEDDRITSLLTQSEVTQPIHCLPLYSMLSKDKQDQVFVPPPPGHRLCVIATNVAETSLTIPGIKYVVDTGKAKKKVYDKTTGVSAFIVTWASKASADQRAGRAGRTSAGHSYRLYSSAVFTNDFQEFTEAEIVSKPIDDLVLQMKCLDIMNICNFPFPTPPSTESLVSSEKRLLMMGALREIKTSVSVSGRKANTLTSLGRVMAQFPVSPRYARMLAFAYDELLPYVIALVSGLTVQELFLFNVPNSLDDKGDKDAKDRNKSLQSKWSALRRKWAGVGHSHLLGDLMLMLKAIGASEFTGGSLAFSIENGISHKAMTEVHKLRKQLTNEVNRVFKSSIPLTLTPPEDNHALHLRQISLAGFFDHVARRTEAADTKIAKKKPYQSIQVDDYVFIDPHSALLSEAPEFVVYQEIHETTKMYMRNVVAIEASWLPVYAPCLCSLSPPLEDPSPFYDATQDAVMCSVEGTFGPHSWKLPVSVIEYPVDRQERFNWFAVFFLEGKVIPSFGKNFSKDLLASPKILLKSWASLQPKLMSIVKRLQSSNTCSASELKKKWSLEPQFLLPEVKEWIPVSQHFSLEDYWKILID